jgi:hypothetical protein
MVRVRAHEVFVNCPRYVHKMELVERGTGDLLRADDPARNND